MKKYIVKAWLPSTPFFVAVDPTGQMGMLSEFGFVPRGDWFLASAVAKYHYRPVQDMEVLGDEQSLTKLARKLEKLTKQQL